MLNWYYKTFQSNALSAHSQASVHFKKRLKKLHVLFLAKNAQFFSSRTHLNALGLA